MGYVADIPRRAVTRTAKLATLPIGIAGRRFLKIRLERVVGCHGDVAAASGVAAGRGGLIAS